MAIDLHVDEEEDIYGVVAVCGSDVAPESGGEEVQWAGSMVRFLGVAGRRSRELLR